GHSALRLLLRRIGAIVLHETPLPKPPPAAARQALLAALGELGLDILPAAPAIRQTQARLALARQAFGDAWPPLDDSDIVLQAEQWLAPLLGDPPSFDRAKPDDVRRALLGLLDWARARELDAIAPLSFVAPSGRPLPIDYLAPGGPMIEARAQECFGIKTHPTIARSVRLTVSLLSPAHRQIALTRDLPAFWSGGYRDMAKDMRGRYPKHDWPDDPANAKPHEGRTKARL
ncbi:MAG: ATP-dependent helicase C-terminal domain-containing protein, partial [Parvularculaceae bacterium]